MEPAIMVTTSPAVELMFLKRQFSMRPEPITVAPAPNDKFPHALILAMLQSSTIECVKSDEDPVRNTPAEIEWVGFAPILEIYPPRTMQFETTPDVIVRHEPWS